MSEGTNESHQIVSVKIQGSMLPDDEDMDACQREPMSHVRQYQLKIQVYIFTNV